MDTIRYAHLLEFVLAEFWAIQPSKLDAICAVLARRLAPGAENAVDPAVFEAAAPRTGQVSGTVAILPLFGTIAHRANLVTRASGGTSTEAFGSAFNQAIADKAISAVVIDTDSPGGTIAGVPELAAQIRRGRAIKPVVAVTNSLNASAALWITSGASEIVSIPSGNTGSVGVVTSHESMAKAFEAAGIERSYLVSQNAPHKAEGNETEALSAETRDYLQGRLNDYEAMFIRDLARGRGVSVDHVRTAFGRGRVLSATQAVSAGMIDRVGTLDQVVTELAGGTWRRPDRAEKAEADDVVTEPTRPSRLSLATARAAFELATS